MIPASQDEVPQLSTPRNPCAKIQTCYELFDSPVLQITEHLQLVLIPPQTDSSQLLLRTQQTWTFVLLFWNPRKFVFSFMNLSNTIK